MSDKIEFLWIRIKTLNEALLVLTPSNVVNKVI